MRRAGGTAAPVKYGLKGTIPAAVHKSEGSPAGIREALGRILWFFAAKKSRNLFLISFPVNQNNPRKD